MSTAPCRVLHVVGSLGLGGTEKTAQLLVSALDRSRFLPAVFSPEDGPRRAALEAARVPLFIGGDFFAVLRKFRPHLVHLHRAGWPERTWLRPLLRYRAAGPWPRIVETNVFGRLDDTPEGRAIDLHLFVSRYCRERYGRVYGVPLTHAHAVLYNPVDTELYARLCPERPLATPVVGRLSRPDWGKWSPLAWEFLPLALRELPELCYRIVGCIPEAEAAFAVQGTAERVTCLPPLVDEAQLAAFFNSVSLLAHANDTGESFGLVIAEAMAAGLPVVTHPCPGERDNAQLELVEHGVTGLVAADAPGYAAAVLRLLREPGLAARLGRAGRDKAQRLFAVARVVRELEGHYAALLAGAAP